MPLRECGHDGWQEGCPDCEREHRLALAAMGDEPIEEQPPYVLAQHGMADLGPRRRRDNLAENLAIARECEQAAAEVAAKFPVAARLLMEEASKWR